MDQLLRFILARKGLFALLFLVITGLLGINLTNISIRNSVRDLLSGNQDTYQNYENFLTDFGGNTTLVVELEDFEQAEELAAYAKAISKRVTDAAALNNMVAVVQTNGRETIASINQLDQIFIQYPVLTGVKLSITPQNSNHFEPSETKIAVACADIKCENAYLKELVELVTSITDEYQQGGGQVNVFGSALFNEVLKKSFTREMLKFFVLAFLIVSLFSFIFLSSISGALISMAALIFGIVWSFSFLGVLNIPVSGALQLFPFFVLVVGTCYIIHLLTIFYQKWSVPGVEKEAAIIAAYQTCIKAIIGAALTTILGLLSFCLIEVKVIAQLGLISAIGTFCMTLVAVVFVPAFLGLLPMRKMQNSHVSNFLNRLQASTTRVVVKWAALAIKNYKAVLLTTLAIVLFSIANFQYLKFVYSPRDWLPKNLKATELSRKKIEAGEWNYAIELVLNSETPKGILLDKFRADFEKVRAGFSDSQADLEIVEFHTLLDVLPLNATFDKGLDTLPAIQSDFFQAFADEALQQTKFQILIPWSDHNAIIKRVNRIETFVSELTDYPFYITGKPIILGVMASNLINSLNYGYLFAFVTVFLVMFILLRNWKLNFLCLFPNLIPIIIILGILGFFGVPLDVLLLLTSTIILSISVDDTLHLFLHMQEYMAKGKDQQDATALFTFTHEHVGFSIVATTCLIALSFGLFAFSNFSIIKSVGLVIALGAVLALLADVILVPALYRLLTPPVKDKT